MRILIACEFSGIVRDAFIQAGHETVSCDLLPTEKPGPHFQGDIFSILDSRWDMVIAFPPCTDLCSSGARWFAEKRADGRQGKSIEFFLRIADFDCPKICIENPVGIMSRIWRKPDQIIQPWQFGHAETKATCLWLKGLSPLVPTKIVEPDFMRDENGNFKLDKKGKRYSRIHWMSGRMAAEQRRKERSRTYQGIADCMAATWG